MPLYVYPNPTVEDADYCVISENPVFGEFNPAEDGYLEQAVALKWSEVLTLIADLRRAYNKHKEEQEKSADGIVAAVLMQGHIEAAPGDFS
jgi:hypothetical protein